MILPGILSTELWEAVIWTLLESRQDGAHLPLRQFYWVLITFDWDKEELPTEIINTTMWNSVSMLDEDKRFCCYRWTPLNSNECPLCAKLFLRKCDNKSEWLVLSRRGGSPRIWEDRDLCHLTQEWILQSHSIKITCVKSFFKKRCHPCGGTWADGGHWMGHSISPAFKTYVFTYWLRFIRMHQVSVAVHRIFTASWGIFWFSVRAQ